MSDHSDKEEILRLKRKIVNQNHIIKKHKLESMENRKAVMSAKKECEIMLCECQEEKTNKESSWGIEEKMKAKFRIVHAGAKELLKNNMILKEENVKVEKKNNKMKKEHKTIVAKIEIEAEKKIMKKIRN